MLAVGLYLLWQFLKMEFFQVFGEGLEFMAGSSLSGLRALWLWSDALQCRHLGGEPR